jgi:hypothetical protein
LRYFFSRSYPAFTRILLIESGPRELFDKLIPHLYERFGEHLEIDLVTCYAGVPAGFRGTAYSVNDYPGPAGRKKLYLELGAAEYPIAGIICSGVPIMTKWKWMLAARLPAKILIVNENGDYFWLDRGHWRLIARFALYRAGLTGAAAVPTIARIISFPVVLLYLLLYAATVHMRRKIRTL